MKGIVYALLFVIIGVLLYKLWSPVFSPPKRDIPVNEARLYFFYTDWCGWSKKAMPEWEKLKAKLGDKAMFGETHVTLVPINAETDRKTAELYEVEGYPTVLLERAEGITTFKKRPTYDSLLHFLRQSLGKESPSL